MLTTPHLLVGAAIGSQFNNPILIATTAAASHFVLDSIPHLGFVVANGKIGVQWKVQDLDKKDIGLVAGDVLLGISLLTILTWNNPKIELMLLGAFCAFLPDFHHTLQVLFGPEKLKRYTKLHLKFHYKKPMRLLPGMLTQVMAVLVAILVVLSQS